VGQLYNPAGQFEILIPSTASSNQGYVFNFSQNSGAVPCYLVKSSSFSANTTAAAAGTTYYVGTTAAITGWMNIAIYVGANGYMAAWVNDNLVVDCTDYTYTPNPAAVKYGITSGWGSSGYTLAPAPNAPGAGSTGLNAQVNLASITGISSSGSYSGTSVTITWSPGTLYFGDGSTVSVAGNYATFTQTLGTTCYYSPYWNIANGMQVLDTGTSKPTLAQQAQILNGDGSIGTAAGTYITVTIPSGGGSGTGGGGAGYTCFSPNTRVKTHRGEIAIVDVQKGDLVLTARGTWRPVGYVTAREWEEDMLDMGHEELSTPGHRVLHMEDWMRIADCGFGFPEVAYKGTIHNLHIQCDEDDNGLQPDTEHSYTLANGLVVHNMIGFTT
jgi:hypothetical protein